MVRGELKSDDLFKKAGCTIVVGFGENIYSLKAAGTPMMRPLPEASSLDRLTLSLGEPSTRSTLGRESPTLTMLTGVWWKVRMGL